MNVGEIQPFSISQDVPHTRSLWPQITFSGQKSSLCEPIIARRVVKIITAPITKASSESKRKLPEAIISTPAATKETGASPKLST